MIQTAVIRRPLCSTTGRRKPVRLPSAVDCSSRRWWVLAVARNGVGKKNAVTPRSLFAPTRPRQQVGFARIIDPQITSSRLRMSLREPSLHLIETREDHWTSAEIKSCCRLASLLDVPLVQAAQNVVPVAVTAGDKIESLRQWASGRCLSADRAGVYSRAEGGGGGPATGGRIWGLLMDRCCGPSRTGRRRCRRRGGGCWREASGWTELPHASPLYDSSHHFEATNKR